MTREIDYRRAFKIACDLLNGDVLYGVDSDEIFKTMMDRDGVVTKDSYEEYILNHLQELDHGEYAIKALEQEPCEDCISRQATIDEILKWSEKYDNADVRKGFHHAETVLYDMPPAKSIKPKGHWIIKEGREEGYDIAGIKSWYIQIMCDKCGFIKTAIEGHTGQYHYCPSCGAKMESEEIGLK